MPVFRIKVSYQVCPKFVAMAMSLEGSENEVHIDNLRSNTYHLMKKIAKISPADPEIIGL